MKNEQTATIIVVVMTAFITSFTGSALNIAIPDIGAYFGAASGLTSWIITGYTAAVALVSVPAGRLADLKGRKKVMITGLGVFFLSSATAGISFSAVMLIVCRAVQGVGAAMIFSTNTAILAEVYDSKSRGRALGYALASTYAGLSAGPVLGGLINHSAGWRLIFAVPAAVTLISLLIAFKIPATEVKRAKEFTDTGILKKPAFAASSMAALINYGASFTLSYMMPVYLQVVQGCSSRRAGFIMLAQPVVISILSPLAGRKSDSTSPFKLAAAGMAVCGAGIACAVLPGLDDRWMMTVLAALVVTGTGTALFSSPNTNAVMAEAGPENYGFASSVLSAMRALGNTFGMLVINAVSAVYLGDVVLKEADSDMIVKTMVTVMALSAGACIPGTLLAGYKKK